MTSLCSPLELCLQVKFLIDKKGQPVKRFGPQYDPLKFEDDIKLLLADKPLLPEECKKQPGRRPKDLQCSVSKILAEA